MNTEQVEKMEQVKKALVKEVEDTNLSRMLLTLNIPDDIEMSFVSKISDVN